MPELLAELTERGHQLAVATGKPRRGLDRALQASGIGALFAATRCGDETQPKPHPAMLLELMAELQLGAADMLMIGDTSHDLGMAKSAGVDAVAVTYGAHPEESLLRVRAARLRLERRGVATVADGERLICASAALAECRQGGALRGGVLRRERAGVRGPFRRARPRLPQPLRPHADGTRLARGRSLRLSKGAI